MKALRSGAFHGLAPSGGDPFSMAQPEEKGGSGGICVEKRTLLRYNIKGIKSVRKGDCVMGNKHLSEVLSASEILDSNENRICILAGVGAGKNTFVTKKLRGHGNILFVSSRRATINEMLLNELCQEKVDWSKLSGDLVTTTNYGIELLVKNKKFSTTGIKNLIEHFDIIVVDEFHSLKADATFSNPSFHLSRFLRHISEKYHSIKVIVMTGTEAPIKDILERDKYWIIDKRKECINVLPQKIEVITRKKALEIMKRLPKTQKTIYYTNSTRHSIWGKQSLYRKLTSDLGISINEIVVALAKDKAEKISKMPENPICFIERESEEVKAYVVEKRALPENVRFLITTSTLKEGINIESDDIKIAFCESHVLSDIQQFAGRVRKGLDTLYIINDGVQFVVTGEQHQANFIKILFEASVLKRINDFLSDKIRSEESAIYDKGYGMYNSNEIEMFDLFSAENWSIYCSNEATRVFIDMIEEKFDYVRFNHIYSKFEIFEAAYREQERIYEYFKEGWEKAVREFCARNGIGYINNTDSKEVNVQELSVMLKEYLNKKLTEKKDKDALLLLISNSLGLGTERPKIGTCTKALRKYGVPYTVKCGHTTRAGENVRYYEVTTYNTVSEWEYGTI